MRDPKRISKFLEILGQYWSAVPDWRFGQFITNIARFYGGDIWFLEEDQFIEVVKSMFGECEPNCSGKES